MTHIDRIDREILVLLARNARTTNKDLAAAVGLSQSACLERVRRLDAAGVLRGSHADIDPHALGIGVQALVAVKLKQHNRNSVDRFEKAALGLPQVVALYHTTGESDFVAHVVARDMDHLRDFTLDAIALSPVAHVQTSLIFNDMRKPGWPDLTVE